MSQPDANQPTASQAANQPDVIVIMTDEERAIPPYESDDILAWRNHTLTGRAWFDEHAVNFNRHYTGSLACVPSRPTIFTGHYPDVHGVTQTDGLGKMADDSRLRLLREGEVPTLGNWFRAAGYDTHYDGKWHISHADLHQCRWVRRRSTRHDERRRGQRRCSSSTRTTSCCSRHGRVAATRSLPGRSTRHMCPQRPPPTRISPTSRPRRSPTARPTRRGTGRSRRWPAPTGRRPRSTATSTTASTPRSTDRSIRSAVSSPTPLTEVAATA